MKKQNSKVKGNVTELETAVALIRRNCGVCIPYGDRNKYDLVADIDGKFIRIQCKTSQACDNGAAFKFSTRSSYSKHGKSINTAYTANDIDYFATMFNNKCYLFPVGEKTKSCKILRLEAPKNSQQTDINFAKSYEIDEILNKIRNN